MIKYDAYLLQSDLLILNSPRYLLLFFVLVFPLRLPFLLIFWTSVWCNICKRNLSSNLNRAWLTTKIHWVHHFALVGKYLLFFILVLYQIFFSLSNASSGTPSCFISSILVHIHSCHNQKYALIMFQALWWQSCWGWAGFLELSMRSYERKVDCCYYFKIICNKLRHNYFVRCRFGF